MDELAQQQTGRDVKERREKIGVSQEELAKEAGISYRTVMRFEKGNKIRDKKLLNVVNALGRLEKSQHLDKKQSLWWVSHKRTDTDSFKRT